jgi:hypothetical protein
MKFEPVGPSDEAQAPQETAYLNHVFMQHNPSFMMLYFSSRMRGSPRSNRQGVLGRSRGRAARDLGMGCKLSDVIGSKMVAVLARRVGEGRRVPQEPNSQILRFPAWRCATPGKRQPSKGTP